ncbi:uncharacterized protein LOC101860221 isoform X2 [Aplysia californica]|uniref:Uncharacterized protein LOC101860221 isoform X2 n=1 Tax=Aplysia californica TaxID=6500 RepID=A0ABM0JCH1_APLCA|nr:uncharacterized protein LOC101860221 isoform X2 [Aplysia californica]
MWRALAITLCLTCYLWTVADSSAVVEKRGDLRSQQEMVKIVQRAIMFRKDAAQYGSVPGMSPNNSCACVNYTCGCCLHLEVEKIHLNDTGCVNISYLPEEYGLEVDVTLDGRIVYQKKISAKNPPPVCAPIPYVHKLADLCIRFYNLSVHGKQFSGCADIEFTLEGITVKTFNIGCFQIPPSRQIQMIKIMESVVLSEASLMP